MVSKYYNSPFIKKPYLVDLRHLQDLGSKPSSASGWQPYLIFETQGSHEQNIRSPRYSCGFSVVQIKIYNYPLDSAQHLSNTQKMRVPSLTTRCNWTGNGFYLTELNICDMDQNAKPFFPPENTIFEFSST